MIRILRRRARDCSRVQKITWCTQARKIAWENNILRAVSPQDMIGDSEPPDLEKIVEPITDEGDRSLDAPTPCRNRISGISCVKLRVNVPGKVLEV